MKKIAVVGSINMDMTVTADRIPSKGETIKGNSISYIPGGKGANQAVAAGRLGADVDMFGCVGDDSFGETLVNNLNENGVCTDYIKKVAGVSTGLAVITVGENDNTIVILAGANDYVDVEYIKSVEDKILESEVIVLQHEIPQETIEYVVELGYRNNKTVILNPAPAREVKRDIIDKISYLTPNEHETSIIFGSDDFEGLMKKYPEKLIITMGSRGVYSVDRSGEIINVPALKTEVADTTGAGDTLNGAFAVSVLNGVNIKEALVFANTAAGISVGKFGAQGGMPTYDEVMNRMK